MKYHIAISEVAEAEMEGFYFRLLRFAPEAAGRWYDGLLDAIASLDEMPRRYALARENDRYQTEVRQLLYGRGRSVCRVLYTIVEPEHEKQEPTVRVLHIRHAAQDFPEESVG